MTFDVDSRGIAQLQKDLFDAPQEIVDLYVDEAEIFGRKVIRTAKQIVHVDTGITKNSLDAVVVGDGPGLVEFVAGSLIPSPLRSDEQRITVAAINEFVIEPYMGPAMDKHFPVFERKVAKLLPEPVFGKGKSIA